MVLECRFNVNKPCKMVLFIVVLILRFRTFLLHYRRLSIAVMNFDFIFSLFFTSYEFGISWHINIRLLIVSTKYVCTARIYLPLRAPKLILKRFCFFTIFFFRYLKSSEKSSRQFLDVDFFTCH